MSSRSTTRILELGCPLCCVPLKVHVRGVAPGIDGETWLDSLDIEVWQYLHDEHERTEMEVVAPPRLRRTRRIT